MAHIIRSSCRSHDCQHVCPFDHHRPPDLVSPIGALASYHRATFSTMSDHHTQDSGPATAHLTNDPSFDILEWHPAYESCQRFFLDHAQHEPATQAVCALINIRLPFQWLSNPIYSSTSAHPSSSPYNFAFRGTANNLPSPARGGNPQVPPSTFVSLVPYVRRLIVTAFDKNPILHGFFGDDYTRGILPHVDCERRNYLFAAKHGGWGSCKRQYDVGSAGGGDESVPFMKPLDQAKMPELTEADKAWSSWLAMEDWMVGPRAPGEDNGAVQDPQQGSRFNGLDHGHSQHGGSGQTDRSESQACRSGDPGMPQNMVDGVDGHFFSPH